MLNHGTKIAAAVLTVFFGVLAPMAPAPAQNYPGKTIRLVVPFSPGGGNDVLGRIIAARLTEQLGQTVIVDNRPGGGGNIGTEAVAHASPDGYMLLYTSNSFAIGPALSPLNYSLNELAPVSMVASFPIALVTNASLPVKNLSELVALAKQRGGLNYGSPGAGSANHLTGVLLNNVAGLANVHVPYKGAGPMMTGVLGGEIEMATPNVFTAAPFVRDGRLRAIAVTGSKPSASLPGVPTLASVYPGFDDTSVWHGLFTTAGTPAPVLAILHRETLKALQTPKVREAIEGGGGEIVGNTPTEFSAAIAKDVEKYARLVKLSGAKAD